MNTPNPLVPQGASPSRAKSSLYFKVMMIISLHVVLIGGMLLQGCKDTKPSADAAAAATNDTSTATASTDTSNLPPVSPNYTPPIAPATNAGYAETATPAVPSIPAVTNTTVYQAPMPIAPVSVEGKEYTIVAGDRLASIAHRNGVTLKALMAANPGVDAKRLRIGAKLTIPGSDGSVASASTGSSGAMTEAAASSGDGSVYVVKAGDMLGRIAKAHGTTVKKIMALNELKSTQIRVGQTLKLPIAAASAPAAAPSASASVPATGPMVAPTPATAMAN